MFRGKNVSLLTSAATKKDGLKLFPKFQPHGSGFGALACAFFKLHFIIHSDLLQKLFVRYLTGNALRTMASNRPRASPGNRLARPDVQSAVDLSRIGNSSQALAGEWAKVRIPDGVFRRLRARSASRLARQENRLPG